MTRPAQVALIVVIFANGVLLALWRDGSWSIEQLLAMAPALLLLVLAAAATHLANEAADHETDRLSTRTAFSGGSGALEASGLRPRVPLAASLGLSAIVIVGALLAVGAGALPAVAAALLLLGLAGGLAYSLPPLAAERRGWGEPLNAILGALLLPLFGVAAMAGAVDPLDVLAFLPFMFVALASVLATAWPDREADAATGKATMQVRLDPAVLRRIASWAFVAFVVTSLASTTAGALPAALAGLAVAPLLLLGLGRYTRSESPIANVVAMVGLALITFGALVLDLAANGAHA
jgi:1,4-dihydroxy-2-naphthoate octaprenyltransferase